MACVRPAADRRLRGRGGGVIDRWERLESVIWDFNGTLVDDVDVVLRSVNAQLAKRGLPALTPARYREVFGFPVADYYRRIGLDVGTESMAGLSAEFHAHYAPGLADCPFQIGAREVLDALRDRGVRQFVLSAMEERLLRATVDRLGVGRYFEAVYGLAHREADSKLSRGVQLIRECGIDADRAILIGDTDHDAQVAATLGIEALLVARGHQSVERLRRSGTVVFETLFELRRWIGGTRTRGEAPGEARSRLRASGQAGLFERASHGEVAMGVEETGIRQGRFDLLIEDAQGAGVFGHIPELPGLCFRAESAAEAERAGPGRIREYAGWLADEGLNDLTDRSAGLIHRARSDEPDRPCVVVTERVAGAPVWESGNAAALFARDLCPLDDAAVLAHLRFVRSVLAAIRVLVSPLSMSQRARRPAPGRRSIDETLEHIGNCVWWYGSRIDDQLPEPDEPPGDDPLDRIDRLFESAAAHLSAVPPSERSLVCVPNRFPTRDPQERWTHTKVCRRQAEHAWEHLPGLRAASEAASREKTSTKGSPAG